MLGWWPEEESHRAWEEQSEVSEERQEQRRGLLSRKGKNKQNLTRDEHQRWEHKECLQKVTGRCVQETWQHPGSLALSNRYWPPQSSKLPEFLVGGGGCSGLWGCVVGKTFFFWPQHLVLDSVQPYSNIEYMSRNEYRHALRSERSWIPPALLISPLAGHAEGSFGVKWDPSWWGIELIQEFKQQQESLELETHSHQGLFQK